MISLHVVSGPWTSIVAALDKGRFNIAVCRRYSHLHCFYEDLPGRLPRVRLYESVKFYTFVNKSF
jgi:hypothetical protein